MDIDEIRTFVSIARLGGFTRAAEQLNRSQPAISRRIEMIEQDLDVVLFERKRGGVTLTAAGDAFLPFAEVVLAAIKDGRDAVRATTEEVSGRVSLALVGTLADTRIVEVVRKFERQSNGASLDLTTANSQEISDLVRRGDATLGLRYFSDDRPEFVSKIVAREEMLVICSAEHRLAGCQAKAQDLVGERWIGFQATRGRESFGHILKRRLISAGLDEAQVTIIDSLTAQKRLVEAGFGIALVPRSSVREEIELGLLREIAVSAIATKVPIAIIHRRNGYLNSATLALISILKEKPPKAPANTSRHAAAK